MLDFNTDIDPTHLMEDKGYGQISDEVTLTKIIEETITQYPEQVNQFKAGKEPLIKFLIGMVMKTTEGSADPLVVEKLFREKLAK
jgi:aspartyl-tRNA(Asn)/glutamyl-tRNA(Gln) amidotransferase subunit B